MEGFTDFTEYIVKKKCTGVYLLKRICFYFGCAFLSVVMTYVILTFKIFASVKLISPLFFFSGFLLMLCLNKYFFIEYEYRICGGEFSVDIIYGKKKRKNLLSVDIEKFETVMPYNGETEKRTTSPDIEKTIEAVSDLSAPDVYFAVYKNNAGKREVLFFEATEKILSLIKRSKRSLML